MRVILPGLVTTVAVCVLSMHSYGACVWRVSDDTGKVLYLGGSIHALTSTDYPLPAAYNRAFDASAHLVLEANPKEFRDLPKNVLKAGEYPNGDNLKNHVDPRTYDYLRRFFGLIKVPEEKFSRYRPWLLAEMLEAPPITRLVTRSRGRGILNKARANEFEADIRTGDAEGRHGNNVRLN